MHYALFLNATWNSRRLSVDTIQIWSNAYFIGVLESIRDSFNILENISAIIFISLPNAPVPIGPNNK